MATITAIASGAWTADAATVWDSGVVPPAGSDVDFAGFAVALDMAATPALLALRASGAGYLTIPLDTLGDCAINATTITAGSVGASGFIRPTGTTSNTLTINGNIADGASCTIYANTTGFIVLVGNISGSSTNNVIAFNNYGAGRVTITGNITASSGQNSHGFFNRITGTLNQTGNVTGGSVVGSPAPAYGISLGTGSTGAIALNGTLTGGSGVGCMAVYNQNTGVVTLNAACILINTANGGVAYGGTAPVWAPAATSYHQYSGAKMAPEVAAGNLLSGVQNGTVTGTLSASNIYGM